MRWAISNNQLKTVFLNSNKPDRYNDAQPTNVVKLILFDNGKGGQPTPESR